MTDLNLEEILRPPTEAEVERAIAMFTEAVRAHYGSRLKGLYLFGSRARGDHGPHSDADVAVVLSDENWDFWKEKRALTDLALDAQFGTPAYVQAWPVADSKWLDPESHHNPRLIRAMREEGRPLNVGT